MLDGYKFWKNVDRINPYRSARAMAKEAGIDYKHMTQQRADSTVPKGADLLKMAQTMHVSIESLLTGEDDVSPLDFLSEEARFVEQSSEMKTLVRYCMRDSRLLSAFKLILEAARTDSVENTG